MLLQRRSLGPTTTQGGASSSSSSSSSPSQPDDPLACMIYFFASQMNRNLSLAAIRSDSRSGESTDIVKVHRLDTLLAKISVHASFSPLITYFETFPVEIPPTTAQLKRQNKPPKEAVHDTLLLVKFRSKRAREEWIETREWREFMQQTEAEDIFRRIPHVRCARSFKGLKDPIEVLST